MMPVTQLRALPVEEAATIAAAVAAGAGASIDARGRTGEFMETSDDLSVTPLLWSMSYPGEHEACAHALLAAGAKSAFERVKRPGRDFVEHDTPDMRGMDALMVAASGRALFSTTFVVELLDQGACLGHLNMIQHTALMIAIKSASVAVATAIVEWVRARGAEVDSLPAPLGMPPTRMADAFEVPEAIGYRALHFVASFGFVALVSALVSAGADKEAHCIGGWTPLMVAAGSRQMDTVRALPEAGAFVNNHDCFGVAALHVAIAHSAHGRDMSCFDALVDWPGIDLRATTITGLSPLVLARLSGNVLAVAHLQKRLDEDGRVDYESERVEALSVKQLQSSSSKSDGGAN